MHGEKTRSIIQSSRLRTRGSSVRTWLAALALLALLGSSAGAKAGPPARPAPPAPPAAHRVIYSVIHPKQPQHKRLLPILAAGLMPELAEGIGSAFRLPRDLRVEVQECNQKNSMYVPAQHGVVLCYELAWFYAEVFKTKPGIDEKKTSLYVRNAMTFVMLHELGHALIGELGLGVMGNEEDAVDTFAALLATDVLKKPGLALDGAEALRDFKKLKPTKEMIGQMVKRAVEGDPRFKQLKGKEREKVWRAAELAFRAKLNRQLLSDTHALDDQRYYNVLCFVYGSDPKRLGVLVTKGLLPKERAVRCAVEHRKKLKGWVTMLTPYRVKRPKPKTEKAEPPTAAPKR